MTQEQQRRQRRHGATQRRWADGGGGKGLMLLAYPHDVVPKLPGAVRAVRRPCVAKLLPELPEHGRAAGPLTDRAAGRRGGLVSILPIAIAPRAVAACLRLRFIHRAECLLAAHAEVVEDRPAAHARPATRADLITHRAEDDVRAERRRARRTCAAAAGGHACQPRLARGMWWWWWGGGAYSTPGLRSRISSSTDRDGAVLCAGDGKSGTVGCL